MERQLTFTEAAIGDGFRLDAENGIAYGVAVCGPVSQNGRDYPDSVRDRDKAVYEGSQVYIDHRDGERQVREWFGELQNPRTRVSDRRTIADHHYPKNSSFTAEYEERASKFPRSLGFSHVAVCQTKRINGREVIEAISRVHSVDLVAKPATNAGIAESFQPRKPMKLSEYVAAVVAKWPDAAAKLKTVREMDGMDDMEMDAPPPVEEMPSMDDPVKAAFSSAMHALVDQYDAGEITDADLMSKLKTLMKAAGKMAGGGDAPAETESDDDKKDYESIKKQLADVLKENAKLRLDTLIGDTQLTPVQRKAVGLLDSEADRKALVESFKAAAAGQKPKSGEQNRTKQVTEQAGSIPTDGKAFAESLKRAK